MQNDEYPRFHGSISQILANVPDGRLIYQRAIKAALKGTGLPQAQHDSFLENATKIPGSKKYTYTDPIDFNRRLQKGKVDNKVATAIHFLLHQSLETRHLAKVVDEKLIGSLNTSQDLCWWNNREASPPPINIGSSTVGGGNISPSVGDQIPNEYLSLIQSRMNSLPDLIAFHHFVRTDPVCICPIFSDYFHTFKYEDENIGIRNHELLIFNPTETSIFQETFTLVGNVAISDSQELDLTFMSDDVIPSVNFDNGQRIYLTVLFDPPIKQFEERKLSFEYKWPFLPPVEGHRDFVMLVRRPTFRLRFASRFSIKLCANDIKMYRETADISEHVDEFNLSESDGLFGGEIKNPSVGARYRVKFNLNAN